MFTTGPLINANHMLTGCCCCCYCCRSWRLSPSTARCQRRIPNAAVAQACVSAAATATFATRLLRHLAAARRARLHQRPARLPARLHCPGSVRHLLFAARSRLATGRLVSLRSHRRVLIAVVPPRAPAPTATAVCQRRPSHHVNVRHAAFHRR